MREGAPTILKAGFLFRCSPDPEFQKWCWMTQAHPNVHLHLAVPHGIQSARRPRGKTRTASIHQPMVGGREPRLLDYFKRSTNLRLIKGYDGAHRQAHRSPTGRFIAIAYTQSRYEQRSRRAAG